MVKTPRRAVSLALLGGVVFGAGCKPEFAERSSAVQSLRVLAIQSDPAEAQPRLSGPTLQYWALIVDPQGPRDDVALDWAYCTQPKPVSELNDVSPACFARAASWIIPMTGAGSRATSSLPSNACRQFGPDPPEIGDGGVLGRPADPDSTGGYYQPLRILSSDSEGVEAVGQTRLRCDLAGATSDDLREYSLRYRINTNPAVGALVAVLGSEQVVEPDASGVVPLQVPAGAAVHFRLSWATCDTNVPCPDETADQCAEPDACTGSESYVLFDLASRRIVERRESMRVSWFATAGSFANDNTGRAVEEYPNVTTDNDWVAPPTPGDAFLWAVLRDSRGGASWQRYRLSVF
jgi:hypothetical protein